MAILLLCRQPLSLCVFSIALHGVLHAELQLLPLADRSLLWQEQVFAAWDQRGEAIKSFTMIAEIEQVIVGRGNRPPDPPGPGNDTRPIDNHLAKVDLEYAYENRKAALKRISEGIIVPSDPERPQPQTMMAAYDGRVNASFVQQGGFPRVLGEMAAAAEPGPALAVNMDLTPILLWRQPKKFIGDIGWQIDKMSLEETDVKVDGIEYQRIRIPRKDRVWTSALDVDAKRRWLPIQWQGWLGGKLMFKFIVKYNMSHDFGPVVNTWQNINNDGAGKLEQSRKGSVIEYTINKDVDDSRFTVDFPLGSHVIGREGKKRNYFIKTPEGLQPMDKENYGRVEVVN